MFAVKLALKLNNREATLMAKYAGFQRVIFSMGLSLRTQMYGEGKFSDSQVINFRQESLDQLRQEASLKASLNILNWEPSA